MDEAKFLELIDARFPYADRSAALDLIAKARSISAHATFAVLEEIARPPRSAEVDEDRQLELCLAWADGFEHPLKAVGLECARALISGEGLDGGRAAELQDLVAGHAGAWAALNLVYFAGVEPDEAYEARDEAIRAAWRRAG